MEILKTTATEQSLLDRLNDLATVFIYLQERKNTEHLYLECFMEMKQILEHLDFFQYRTGYINVDDGALYSEILTILERPINYSIQCNYEFIRLMNIHVEEFTDRCPVYKLS